MSRSVEFEDIEAMRQEAGIDDVELREAVSRLRVGDRVRLTVQLPKKSFPGPCVLVRITSIKGRVFRGKLARAAGGSLTYLPANALFTFTGDHIHSIPGKAPADTH